MREIVVYVDEGVNGKSLRHTVKSISQEMDKSSHRLKRMDAAALKRENWEKKTDLLVIPGGRDIFYHEKLKGAGSQRIREFIEGGGSYFGICAGAYFGAGEIEFEKGGHLEVCGKRSLAFFPGKAVGPALGLGKFHYDSEKGADAALITWDGASHCFTYFNGGCYFAEPQQFDHVDVIARYAELKENPAAVVSCQVGRGRAILSGVHLEYHLSELAMGSPYLIPIAKKLQQTDEKRRTLFRQILQDVSLKLIS